MLVEQEEQPVPEARKVAQGTLDRLRLGAAVLAGLKTRERKETMERKELLTGLLRHLQKMANVKEKDNSVGLHVPCANRGTCETQTKVYV